MFSTAEEITTQELHGLDSRSYDDFSRRDVRSLVFHYLYAAEAFDYQESLHSIVDNFNRGFDLNVPFESELFQVTQAIISNRSELEKVYEPFLSNWRAERVSVCTKLILLFAIWEFKNTATDARIIINEAIELAKAFAEEDAYKFINGVLDPISKDFRKELSISNES
jgi:N utilization substance protein B